MECGEAGAGGGGLSTGDLACRTRPQKPAHTWSRCRLRVGTGQSHGSRTPYPVGIVVDLDVGILVHGGEGHAVFQLVREDPSVHHVIAEGVEQLDVDVAHQGVQHFLEGGSAWP